MRMSRTAIPVFMNESGNYNDRLEEREGGCFKNSGSSREVAVAGSMSILWEGKSIGDLHFLPQRGGSSVASRSVSQNKNIATIVCMHIIGTTEA